MARTRWLFGLVAIVAALLLPLAAQAAGVSNGFLNSGGNLYSMDTAADNAWGGTQAFWNNSSYDGAGCNVGFVLTGYKTGSACGGVGTGPNLSTGNLQFLAGATKTAPASFYFNTPLSPASPANNVTFIFEKTAANDAVYWFNESTSVSTQIFSSAATAGALASVSIPVGVNWALEFTTDYYGGTTTYFSDGSGSNQFALFLDTTTGKYYAGMEDIHGTGGPSSCSTCSDLDYNDAVVTFTPVPEPATMFLGGLGLIAFGYAARRRLFGR